MSRRKKCSACGGENIRRDAWAEWDVETQQYVLSDWFETVYCIDCDTITDEVETDEET